MKPLDMQDRGKGKAETRWAGWQLYEEEIPSLATWEDQSSFSTTVLPPLLPKWRDWRREESGIAHFFQPLLPVLLSKQWLPGFQPPGRRYGGSFTVKLTGPREKICTFYYLGVPMNRARTLSQSFLCETLQKPSSAYTWGFHQLLNASFLNRTRQPRIKVIWGSLNYEKQRPKQTNRKNELQGNRDNVEIGIRKQFSL